MLDYCLLGNEGLTVGFCIFGTEFRLARVCFCGSRDWKQQYHDGQLLLLTAAIKAIDNVSKSLVRRGSEKDRLAKQIVNAASPTNARG